MFIARHEEERSAGLVILFIPVSLIYCFCCYLLRYEVTPGRFYKRISRYLKYLQPLFTMILLGTKKTTETFQNVVYCGDSVGDSKCVGVTTGC